MWLAIVAFVLILSAIFVAFLTIYRDEILSPNQSLRNCPVGWCVSNIISGAKRCPAPDEVTSRTSTAEVCNPRRSCTDGLTPNLLYDFSIGTVTNNFCPADIPDEKCMCMNSTYCPVQYTSYFTTVGDRILTNTSYLNPIVRNITVNDRPFATGLNNGSCTTASPERLWPPELNLNNNCLAGRLVRLGDSGQYACISNPQVDSIVCPAPRRIIEQENGSYVCAS